MDSSGFEVVKGPLIGILQGVLLIIFRKPISRFLTYVFECFPKSRLIELNYNVRPIFITAFGIVIIGFSLLSFFATR